MQAVTREIVHSKVVISKQQKSRRLQQIIRMNVHFVTMSKVLSQPWLFAGRNASPNGICKHNCDREYENGDRKPGPSPDILLNGDSHRFTLTVPAHRPFNPFHEKSCSKIGILQNRLCRVVDNAGHYQMDASQNSVCACLFTL
jgi:hypothetical protein